MSVSAPVAPKANGLATVLNVITAPRDAFETLRGAPMWGWAYVVSVVLAAIGSYLVVPATMHAIAGGFPAQIAADPRLAGMSPEKQHQALALSLAFVKWFWLAPPITVLIAVLASSVVMLIFKAAGRGEGAFKTLWAAAANIAVVGFGLYSLCNGLIAMVRGPASYNSAADAFKAMPSLAWLAPHAGVKMTAFLAAFNPFGIWSAVLVALAMIVIARTSKISGGLCGLAILIISGAFATLGAR